MKTSIKRTMMIGSLLLTLGACSSGEPEKGAAPQAGQPAAATTPAPDTAMVKQAVDKAVQQAGEAAQAAEKAAANAAEDAVAAAKAAEEAAAKAAEDAAAAAQAARQKAARKASEAAAAMKQQAQASKQLAEGMAAATQAREAAPVAEKAAAPKAASAPAVASIPTAKGDAAKGKTLARKCAACHNFDARGKVGPGLGGVFNRVAGSVEGFNYKFAGFIEPGKAWRWDASHLAAWVCNSADAVRNFTGNESARTKMTTQRICDPADQADLIAFLKTL